MMFRGLKIRQEGRKIRLPGGRRRSQPLVAASLSLSLSLSLPERMKKKTSQVTPPSKSLPSTIPTPTLYPETHGGSLTMQILWSFPSKSGEDGSIDEKLDMANLSDKHFVTKEGIQYQGRNTFEKLIRS